MSGLRDRDGGGAAGASHRLVLRLHRIRAWAERRGDFAAAEILPVFPNGFFKIVRLKQHGLVA